VKWSPQALRDVQRLHQYLLARNADAAKRAVKTIRAGVRVLAKQPGVGRPIEDMDPAFREWPIDFGDAGYVVLYRIEGKGDVVILAVRHQREAGF
jgi:plasmid stabilization system protein ParE